MDRVFLGKYRVPTTKSSQWWEARRSQFGVICQAEEKKRGRKVVLEFVPAFLLGEPERKELRRAANAARQIRHINIPLVYEFGEEGEQFIYVMEYVNGLTTKSWIAAHGPMPIATALGIALQVLSALRVAAQHDLHHPAIHPGNLMIVSGETAESGWPLVKVLHFPGAPRALDAFDVANPMSASTAPFASPEQIAGAPVDFRSEAYSLGATLWFLISATTSGLSPGRADKKRAILPDLASGKFAGVPESVRHLLARMLSENRDERPRDQFDLEEEIRACLSEVDPDEVMRPVVLAALDGSAPPAERALWRRFEIRLLAALGAAAVLTVALREITQNATRARSAEVSELSDRPDRGVGLAVARNEAAEEKGSLPAAMNFSVVPPSYESKSGQIRWLEAFPGRVIARGTSLSDEPAPPGEGPDNHIAGIPPKARPVPPTKGPEPVPQ